MGLFVTLSIRVLSAILLIVMIFYCDAECCYAECNYAVVAPSKLLCLSLSITFILGLVLKTLQSKTTLEKGLLMQQS